jgi:hypothetical protein
VPCFYEHLQAAVTPRYIASSGWGARLCSLLGGGGNSLMNILHGWHVQSDVLQRFQYTQIIILGDFSCCSFIAD